MSKKYFDNFKILLVFFLFTFTAHEAFAKTNDVTTAGAKISAEESYSIASRGLAKKMEVDLILTDIKVKFDKVERYAISNSQIGIRGAGTCRLGTESAELPINFDVKINTSSKNIADVKYQFVEAAETETANAPTENEAFVTRHLFEKFKNDFKTENIVIALDYVNEKTAPDGAKILTGAGEVRLGDMVWKKISFEVSPDAQNQNASAINYKVQP